MQPIYNTIEHEQTKHPLIRITTLGEFTLERFIHTPLRTEHELPRYAHVARSEWSNRGPAMTLLKVLLCRANRRASRDELIEIIWPDHEAINATHALDSAASVLRCHILRSAEGKSLLVTLRSGGETIFKLADQQHLWVDADAFLSLASQAARMEYQGQNPLPLLEEAYALARSEFLEDDLYATWAQPRRHTINGTRHRVLFKLVDLYLKDKQMSMAEELLFTALEEEPADEDALCRLMVLLVEQERRQEALQLYQYTKDVLQAEQEKPAIYTSELARRIRQGLVLREQKEHYIATGEQERSPVRVYMLSGDYESGFSAKKVLPKTSSVLCRDQTLPSLQYPTPRSRCRSGKTSDVSS